MRLIHTFFAQEILRTDVIPGAERWMGFTIKEVLLLLGAVAVVTLVLLLWAVYLRKRPRQHLHHHHHHQHRHHSEEESAGLNSTDSGSGNGEKRYRRKRRRRLEHRPRNPTLAETGGLPPLRTEQPPDPLP